jgi:hypothetical protein
MILGIYTSLLPLRSSIASCVSRQAPSAAASLRKSRPHPSLICLHLLAGLRDRERSITWTYQWLCMAPIVLGAVFCDEHAVMHPHLGRAVSSTGTAVARCLRQLHQTHAARAAAQLLQPAAEVLLGPRLFRMVCYQAPPAAAAAVGGAMAYLHAAHGVLCRILQVPESPIRAFWRLRGEVASFLAASSVLMR